MSIEMPAELRGSEYHCGPYLPKTPQHWPMPPRSLASTINLIKCPKALPEREHTSHGLCDSGIAEPGSHSQFAGRVALLARQAIRTFNFGSGPQEVRTSGKIVLMRSKSATRGWPLPPNALAVIQSRSTSYSITPSRSGKCTGSHCVRMNATPGRVRRLNASARGSRGYAAPICRARTGETGIRRSIPFCCPSGRPCGLDSNSSCRTPLSSVKKKLTRSPKNPPSTRSDDRRGRWADRCRGGC